MKISENDGDRLSCSGKRLMFCKRTFVGSASIWNLQRFPYVDMQMSKKKESLKPSHELT